MPMGQMADDDNQCGQTTEAVQIFQHDGIPVDAGGKRSGGKGIPAVGSSSHACGRRRQYG
jgi:hypothetical protein